MPYIRYLCCLRCKGIVAKATSDEPFAENEDQRFRAMDVGPDTTKEFAVGYRLKSNCPDPHVP